MSRGNKRKQKKELDNEQLKVVVENISCSVDIDYDKLAEAIVEAEKRANEVDEKKLKLKKEEEKKERQEIIGYKEYPENEYIFKKFIHGIINFIVMLWNFIFYKRQNVKNDNATFAIIQLATTAIYSSVKWLLYAITILCCVISFVSIKLNVQGIMWSWNFNPVWLWLAFLSFCFARVFRIAVFEIDKIDLDNKDYLLSIFSGTTSFFAMIVALATLIVTVIQ